MSTDRRSRQPEGISIGGQFATEHRPEDASISLGTTRPDTDALIGKQLGDRVRAQVAHKIGDWRGNHWAHSTVGFGPRPPAALRTMSADAARFESLPRSQQRELAGERLAHLIEPNQMYGNDRVALGPDFNPASESAMLGLSAQHQMEASGIPGEITFTGLKGGNARFQVEDQGLVHEVNMSDGSANYVHQRTDQDDLDTRGWKNKASISIIKDGPHKFDIHTEKPRNIGLDYKEHHANAMLADEFAKSPLSGARQQIGALDFELGTAELHTDGNDYTLLASGDDPTMFDHEKRPLSHAQESKVLDRLAVETGHTDGAAYYRELRQVFVAAEKRLQR